jgi:hypothetical protein
MRDEREQLLEERNTLLNSFGNGPVADGRVRDRIAAIDRQRADQAERENFIEAFIKISGMSAKMAAFAWDNNWDHAQIWQAGAASRSPVIPDGSKAVRDVIDERQRQKDVEGWTPEHDDDHANGEMARAAACYAIGRRVRTFWPWSEKWWKPKDRRRDLVRAGALIIAEIERFDRLSVAQDYKP